MNIDKYESLILQSTGAAEITEVHKTQTLWSGYGEIVRLTLGESRHPSVIAKLISFSKSEGSDSDFSHRRKIRSYQVETAWYRKWAQQCDNQCRVPFCLACHSSQNEIFILLEDLDSSGFYRRYPSDSQRHAHTCLDWLANFHARFMGESHGDLWKSGTYWHLSARPEELKCMKDKQLKEAAHTIDKMLKSSAYITIVHGDPKMENFCFAKDGKSVAVVDFQYTGGGCGIKDVAYFIDSCFPEHAIESVSPSLLDYYFDRLKHALNRYGKEVDFTLLESDWRALYPFAWADFNRFLKGWRDGIWRPSAFCEKMTNLAIERLLAKS